MFLNKVNQIIKRRLDNYSPQYTTLGWFGLVNYPAYYLLWYFFSQQSYTNLPLRIIATLLCLGLILRDKFPENIKSYLPLYWYFTLLFCLPFFFTFMVLKNNGSTIWLMNNIVIIFFLILLVDALSFIVLLLLGMALGLAAYLIDVHWVISYEPSFDYLGVLITYVVSITIGVIFAHNKEMVEKNKLETTKAIGSSIAHEMRTPLSALSLQVRGLSGPLDKLLLIYNIACEKNLDIPKLSKAKIPLLKKSIELMSIELKSADSFIDMLLMNVKHQDYLQDIKRVSMLSTVKEAVERYPFVESQRNWVHIECSDSDFYFMGNKLLMIHVFFNLIRNALYYLSVKHKTDKGKNITIKLIAGIENNRNRVVFRDTGTGIKKSKLSKIFTKFYSETNHGVGIGLSFCQLTIESFRGKIFCNSVEGEYTEFVLDFMDISNGEKIEQNNEL